MWILTGFEESQTITTALRNAGHNAYSCDIKPSSGTMPEYHLQMDIFKAIELNEWDMIILHPPCTYTCFTSNRWYANSRERIYGKQLCLDAWKAATKACNKVALEQPKTTVWRQLGRPTQIIHPWQFGHEEKKETWLWLKGLPKLKPTKIVKERKPTIWLMSGKDRGTRRSKTYTGIAQAIVEQWTINTNYNSATQPELFETTYVAPRTIP